MKTTNNLGLKKIELTDSPPDITVQDFNWDIIDHTLKEHEVEIDKANSQLATTSKAEKAGGTATVITLTDVLLTDGSIKNFIVKTDNNAAATTINGKHLYKPNTTTAPKLKIGTAVAVWYDAVGDCFFIKASAGGGNAVAADVLAGKTFGNDDDSDIPGEIPSKAAATYTPGSTDQEIASGQYLSGKQTIKGDADLIPANILKGKDIFGVVGTLDHTDITGQGTASGICFEAITKGDLVIARRHFGFDTPLAMAAPATLPAGQSYGVDFSPDGIYMAVAHNLTPFLSIYKWNGTTYVKLANPAIMPTYSSNAVAFSPDGVYLAVCSNSEGVRVYKRSGDTFTSAWNAGAGTTGLSVSFSPNSEYLAYGHVSALVIYKRSGDSFSTTGINIVGGTTSGYSVAFNSDGTYLAVGGSTPYICVYKRSGDTFTKLANPATLPPDLVQGVAFSPDGIYLACAHNGSPYLTIYKRSGDTFTKLTNPVALPTGTGYAVAFSSDGLYLAVTHFNTPLCIVIYKRSGDIFIKLAATITTTADNTGRGVAWNPLLPHLAFVHNNASAPLNLFKADILGDYFYKYSSFSDMFFENYINFGFAKSSGAINATIDITTIPIK